MTYQEPKSRASMSVGERIQEDQAQKAWQRARRDEAQDRARLRYLARQGLLRHSDGDDPWAPAVIRECFPGCWQHSRGGAS